MKFHSFLTGLAISTFMAMSGTQAHAQNNVIITLNELGAGTLQLDGGPALPFSGFLARDPGPGGLSSALTYGFLGPPNVVGDLFLLDPRDGSLSNVIRFNPDNNFGPVVFYSGDGGSDLADTGFPTAFYANTLTLTLVGLGGGASGVIYTPTASQPGFFLRNGNATYVLISEVPEPGTMALGALGAVAGLALAWRRQRQTD